MDACLYLSSWKQLTSTTSVSARFQSQFEAKIWRDKKKGLASDILSSIQCICKWSSRLEVLISYFLASIVYRGTIVFQSRRLACFSVRIYLVSVFHCTLSYTCISHVYASSSRTVLRKNLQKFWPSFPYPPIKKRGPGDEARHTHNLVPIPQLNHLVDDHSSF